MKLKVLEKLSPELSKHIDNEIDRLIDERNREYDVYKIIDQYSLLENTPISILKSNDIKTSVVESKREICIIFYLLNCPFYRFYGINEKMQKEEVKQLCDALNISKGKYCTYISSAKHYYRIYADFRRRIDNYLLTENISHFYK